MENEQIIKGFLKTDGRRMFYSFIALVMACSFIFLPGFKDVEELKSTGVAILIGIAMYFFNKVRGNTEAQQQSNKKVKRDEKEKLKE